MIVCTIDDLKWQLGDVEAVAASTSSTVVVYQKGDTFIFTRESAAPQGELVIKLVPDGNHEVTPLGHQVLASIGVFNSNQESN